MTFADDTLAGAQRGGAGGQTLPHPLGESLPVPIYLPFPPSVNKIWRAVGGRNIKSQPYRQWQAEAGWELARQRPEKHLGPVKVEMGFTMPDKRRRDLDNLWKAVGDLLVTHQVIQRDDCLFVKDLRAYVANDKSPGVSVVIIPLEAQE